MSKTTKKRGASCTEHEFALTPLHNDLYFKQPVTLSFCKFGEHPKCKAGKKGSAGKGGCLCCPIFNRDHNYATSTFILPEQKKNYIENETKFKEEHEGRIKEYNDEKTELLVPKPKTKHLYCNVCRVNYEDYLEHVKSDLHKISVRRAPFSRLIKDMELRYDKLNQGRNTNSKNSYSTDTTHNGSQSEPEVQMLGLPSKKVKTDFSCMPAFYYPFQVTQKTDTVPQELPQMKTFYSLPMNCYGCGNQSFAQFPTFTTMPKNDPYPAVMPTMNSIPCPMNFNAGMDPNMVVGFPMFYCNSFQQLPQTFYSIPFQPSLQKIDTIQKIEPMEN